MALIFETCSCDVICPLHGYDAKSGFSNGVSLGGVTPGVAASGL
jgi:hypothetical protein